MPSDLEPLTRLLFMQDENDRLRENNVQLRIACALWQRYYEQALLRTTHIPRPTTRRTPTRITQ